MGKRYYCEYCSRAFQDNLCARKKHLHSLIHIKKREEWYRNFKDKKTLYQENLMKKPCNKYLSTGSCPFGDNCKYRHLRPDELEKLKYEIDSSQNIPDLPPGKEILMKWLATRKKSPNQDLAKSEEKPVSELYINPELEHHQPLPPSLMYPPIGGWKFTCDDLAEWG